MTQQHATRAAGQQARPPTPRELLHRARLRALRGDRPYLLLFVGAFGVSVLIVSGPIQTWLTQRDLVDQREGVLAVLEEENDRLAERREELLDPDSLELEARAQGYVPPGEAAYQVVPPAVEKEQIAPNLTDVETDERGWFTRAWEAVAGLFG